MAHSESAATLNRLQSDGSLRGLAISDSGFVFDPRSGQSFTINHTGKEALQLWREGKSIGDACRLLTARYQGQQELVESQLESFIQQLGRYLA